MKILILGNASSMWVKEYVEYVLLPIIKKNDELYLITSKDNLYNQFYEEHNIRLIFKDKRSLLSGIPKVNTIYNLLSCISKYIGKDKLDIIHIHYLPVNYMNYFYNYIIRKYGGKIICSYWGSDLLQGNNKSRRLQEMCLRKSEYITVASKGMEDKFNYLFGNKYSNRIKKIPFGISVLSYIDEIKDRYSKEEIKKIWGVNPEKTLVAIGYNARENQQHDKVIKALSVLSEEIKNKIEIILQFGTGDSSEEYKSKVEDLLSKSGIQYKYTEGFLDKIQTAELRSAVDIFIHAQKTDALSASVQEYLYAGAVVINPQWISYEELKNNGVKYIEYCKFDEIAPIMENIMKNRVDFSLNKECIAKSASWKYQAKKWLDIYNIN